ncbi:MAG: phosphatidate cytidylyltransferase, partial [Solirubrobacterales bacterium]|nr:phosphatidate cytidylyltransferase [Solirubrobacterales bacterium]
GGERGVLLGLGVAVAAPLGDLFESKVKRDAGSKDAGSLFGAHGGALDRLDAVLFSLPTAYYLWLALA